MALGIAFQELGALEDACDAYASVLRLTPGDAPALSNLGVAQAGLGRLAPALDSMRAALDREPDHAVHHCNLGHLLYRMVRYPEARSHLERSVALDPDLAMGWSNLGDVHRATGAWSTAARCYRSALARDPGNGPVMSNLVYVLMTLCAWSELEVWMARLLEASDRCLERGEPSPVDPFVACFLSIDRRQFLAIARSHGRRVEAAAAARGIPRGSSVEVAGAPPLPSPVRARTRGLLGEPRDRVRIGYASAKFARHARGYLVEDMFRHHDRSRVEVIGYGLRPSDGSSIRAHIEAGFDQFRDLSHMGDPEATAVIRGDALDVLVDLDGLSSANRAPIFAARPAPLQVAYLAFPGTSGTRYLDYVVGDPTVTPPEHQSDFTEAIVRVPHCYQVNNHRNHLLSAPAPKAAVGLPQRGIAFCSLNVSRKIDAASFASWMRILQRVPGSVLWLLIDTREALDALRDRAGASAVDPARIIPAPRLDVDRHLHRCQAPDLFLDTFLYNAHTSGADALWAGTPLVTLLGEKFPSRVGASLCRAAEIPETVCSSAAEYEDLAVHLATNPRRLRAYRTRLVERRRSSPLFDTARLVADLESAFCEMAARRRRGLRPGPIDVGTLGRWQDGARTVQG